MYPAYWYSQNAPSSEAFQSTPTIPKQSTPIMKPCNVYTPPGYDKQTQYPLIIIMHGITDNENTWNERSNPNVAKLFDNLITAKVTQPFIAVFAYGTVNDSTNGYYAFGAELTNDLLPFIEANYSVKKRSGIARNGRVFVRWHADDQHWPLRPSEGICLVRRPRCSGRQCEFGRHREIRRNAEPRAVSTLLFLR